MSKLNKKSYLIIYEGKIAEGLAENGISDFELLKGKDRAVGYLYHPQEGFIFIVPKIYKDRDLAPLAIYQALKRYDEDYWSQHNDKKSNSTKVVETPVDLMLRNEDAGGNSDILDIILQLFKFNRENRHFILTELNQIRGHHRIDWRRTIRKTTPAILNGEAAYFNPLSRKREVNSTESLLVMFYSILNYLHTEYPYLSQRYEPEFNLDIIPVELFRQFMANDGNCQGIQYLNRIRSRYFSDKALKLWHLCYAFFSKMASVSEGDGKVDYLLASNFDPIFERMVDDLLSDSIVKKNIMSELKKHGRYLDHIYKDTHPLTGEDGYFIGDSKYYNDTIRIDDVDFYKQVDYANYLIQALFDKSLKDEVYDSETDGYLPIINFFIRGGVEIEGSIQPTVNNGHNHTYWQYHFNDRLFDRSTQLVLDFTINFDELLKAYIEQGPTRKSLATKVKNAVVNEYLKQIEQEFDIHHIQISEPLTIFHNSTAQGKLFLTKQGKLLLSEFRK